MKKVLYDIDLTNYINNLVIVEMYDRALFKGKLINITNKYVWRTYRLIKKEIANTSAFEIDERYFQLRRDLQICEEYLRINDRIGRYI